MDLFKVDFGLTVWMFISFVILLFILWKFAWPAILKGVDQRADLIDKGVEYAQNAKEQLDNAKEESQLTAAIASCKPCLIDVQLAADAGKESGHIGYLNPAPLIDYTV